MTEKFRVLIVNDDPATLRTMYSIVRHHRALQPTLADRASRALETLQAESFFHIIISDLSTSTTTSVDLLKVALEKYPGAKVIVVSGFGDHAQVIEAIKAGAYAYLHKPFRGEELNLMLNNLTRHFAQVTELERLDAALAEADAGIQQKEQNIVQLEAEVRRCEQELKRSNTGNALDLNAAIAKAAAQKTGSSSGYSVSRELANLKNLLDEHKISSEEYDRFRRNVLEKAYQVPLG